MASAAATQPTTRNTAEREIDLAIRRVYSQYGSDLGSFFRDVAPETITPLGMGESLKAASATKKRAKTA